jgi:hypothetical protein
VFILYLSAKSRSHWLLLFVKLWLKENTFLLFCDELDNGHYDALLPAAEEQRLDIYGEH